jgi:hypothetical protein
MTQHITVEALCGVPLERLGLRFRVRNKVGLRSQAGFLWRLVRYETVDGRLTVLHGCLELETGNRSYGCFPADDIFAEDIAHCSRVTSAPSVSRRC